MHEYEIRTNSLTRLVSEENSLLMIGSSGIELLNIAERKLSVAILSHLESFFGCDLATVRVYEGDLHTPVPCRAITCGDSIYIQKGSYNPVSSWGLELLAHEITHVLQQRAGRLPVQVKTERSFIVDPALEAEAELLGRMAIISEEERSFQREDILPDQIVVWTGETQSQAFQPVVYLQDKEQKYDDLWKQVSENFAFKTKKWPRYDKKQGKTVSQALTDLERKQAAKILKFWCDAPMSTKINLKTLTGKAKGRAKVYESMLELIRDLVGQVFVDEGIGRQTEDKLAELIYKHNERISMLLTEAVKRVHNSFHAVMMKNNKHYQEVMLKKERHYAWYYSSLLSKGGYLIGKAFAKKKKEQSPMHVFEANKLRSVESAFQYFLTAKQKKPSWMIVAFLCDYAKLAKEVYPDYFTSIDKDWWDSEAKWYAKTLIEQGVEVLKKQAEEEFKDFKDQYGEGEIFDQMVNLRLEELKKEKADEIHKKYKEDIEQDAKIFKNFTERYDHLFYRLPQMGARSNKTVSQFNVRHPWVMKAVEHQVPLGNGPSASTTFLLAMLQIMYPHEETILAAALAIFEFWNKHYIQIQSDIHTWNEVMIAASPYVYNFDFQVWKKVDKKRDLKDPDAWAFEYPDIHVLQAWLTGKEKKVLITKEQVSEMEKKIALQKQKNRSFKIDHDTKLPDFLKNIK